MDSMITACTLYVSHVMRDVPVSVYRVTKPWRKSSIHFYDLPMGSRDYSDWGVGLTHITIDHHLAAATIGLLLVCAAFAFAYGRLR